MHRYAVGWFGAPREVLIRCAGWMWQITPVEGDSLWLEEGAVEVDARSSGRAPLQFVFSDAEDLFTGLRMCHGAPPVAEAAVVTGRECIVKDIDYESGISGFAWYHRRQAHGKPKYVQSHLSFFDEAEVYTIAR